MMEPRVKIPIRWHALIFWLYEVVITGVGVCFFLLPFTNMEVLIYIVILATLICLLTSEFRTNGSFLKYATEIGADRHKGKKEQLLIYALDALSVRMVVCVIGGGVWFRAYTESSVEDSIFYTTLVMMVNLGVLLIIRIWIERKRRRENTKI